MFVDDYQSILALIWSFCGLWWSLLGGCDSTSSQQEAEVDITVRSWSWNSMSKSQKFWKKLKKKLSANLSGKCSYISRAVPAAVKRSRNNVFGPISSVETPWLGRSLPTSALWDDLGTWWIRKSRSKYRKNKNNRLKEPRLGGSYLTKALQRWKSDRKHCFQIVSRRQGPRGMCRNTFQTSLGKVFFLKISDFSTSNFNFRISFFKEISTFRHRISTSASSWEDVESFPPSRDHQRPQKLNINAKIDW